MVTAVGSRVTGIQAGLILAYLSSRVLGQYELFLPPETSPVDGEQPGRLTLVAPNIVMVERELGVDTHDFRRWVCLHEETHRLQFTAVPWLRDYFAGQVTAFLSGMDDSAASALSRLPDVIREARRRSLDTDSTASTGPVALMELLQSAEQREVFDRLIALSTLLEGHADFVMDAVGPAVVPTVEVIRDRFTDRRRGGGLLDRVLRTLLGVDAKVRQYAAGAAFTRHVVAAAGMTGFNAVWTSAETLPRRSEITDPEAWLRRVQP